MNIANIVQKQDFGQLVLLYFHTHLEFSSSMIHFGKAIPNLVTKIRDKNRAVNKAKFVLI